MSTQVTQSQATVQTPAAVVPPAQATSLLQSGVALQRQRELVEDAEPGAQRDEAVLKRPACGVKRGRSAAKVAPLKRPAAARKKPAAAAKKNWPTEAERLRVQPNVCGKCRGRKGCCDSCWVSRGYERP